MLLSTGNITLCDNKVKASKNDEKVFHLPVFVLDESHCVSSMLVLLMTNGPKCTSR